jgi:hypothetical protein
MSTTSGPPDRNAPASGDSKADFRIVVAYLRKHESNPTILAGVEATTIPLNLALAAHQPITNGLLSDAWCALLNATNGNSPALHEALKLTSAAPPVALARKPVPAVKTVTAPGFRFPKFVDVPEGRYALAMDGSPGEIKFFTVRQVTFVDQHSSDERYSVKGARRADVLARIAADPKTAAVLFGKETNHCFKCGRELTDPVSRELGIGPTCLAAIGW